MAAVAAYSSPRPVASARVGQMPAAVLVALASFAVGAAAVLASVALVVIAGGHGVTLGRQPLLMGAGFACAYAAAVVGLWRGGRLHPAAVAAVWALGLGVAVPGATFAGSAAAVLGGAVAVVLGSSSPLWRNRRLIVGLSFAAAVLCLVAAVLLPARAEHHAAAHPHLGVLAPTHPSVGAQPAIAPAGARPPVATPAHPRPAAATPAPAHPAVATPAPAHPATTPAATTMPGATSTPAAAAPPAATPTPLPPPSPSAVAAATGLVRDFYAALDARDFATAWATLPPALQSQFGGFSAWRAGYGQTLSSRPEQIRVTAAADGGLLVRLVLVATDRTPCGTQTQRFAVRWQLVPGRASWGVASLTAAALDEGVDACLGSAAVGQR
jgi:hypothetical protein